LLALLAGVAPLSRAQAATFEVNLTTDVGDANPLDGFCDSNSTAGGLQCTLRAAIDQANVGAGGDRIEFDIPGAANAVQTISLTTELPDIQVANIVIDGYTQGVAAANTNALIAGGTNAVILIELAGSSTTANGLNLAGGGATVRGLSISGFAAPGGGAIVLTSENNTIPAASWAPMRGRRRGEQLHGRPGAGRQQHHRRRGRGRPQPDLEQHAPGHRDGQRQRQRHPEQPHRH
jgi:hypothetical protein